MKKKFTFILALIAVLLLTSCMSGSSAQAVPAPENKTGSLSPAIPASPPVIRPLPASTLPVTPDDTIQPLASTSPEVLTDTILPLASGNISDIDLTIPASFNITRPSDKLTTTYDKYFITGTSNPDIPIYFGGTEIVRIGKKGTFGVLVDLNIGVNTFKFSQGGKSSTVTITRKAYVPAESIPITEITQSSMVPAVFSGVKVGGSLDLACVAPSGATVSATFNGQSVNLKQVAATQKSGIPALFKGSMIVNGDFDSNVTQKIGNVTYVLKYNGETKQYKSTGDVYVAGSKSYVAVRIKSYMGFVYPNLKDLSIFREKLKKGAVDYVRAQDNTYVELASGGYVQKEQLEIIEGKVGVGNKLSKVKASGSAKSETYTFTGTNKPAYISRLADGKFAITFCNTSGSPDIDVSDSKLFSSVAADKGSNYVTYTFSLKDSGRFWGYNVSYDDNNTVLSFQYKPVLKTGSRPFEGMTIILDPGHGGTDSGALGVAGTTGPTEADVNLAHARAAQNLLSSMGANVILSRESDIFYSLDDRLKDSEALKADMFISIHHNSIGENTDANKIAGMEIYYHTAMSKNLAQGMMSGLSNELNRNNRFVMQSYYRVTLSPYAPSILVELGYMSNPLEYENAANETQINKAAHAIAAGIIKSLS